jgi:hypothetical protein
MKKKVKQYTNKIMLHSTEKILKNFFAGEQRRGTQSCLKFKVILNVPLLFYFNISIIMFITSFFIIL